MNPRARVKAYLVLHHELTAEGYIERTWVRWHSEWPVTTTAPGRNVQALLAEARGRSYDEAQGRGKRQVASHPALVRLLRIYGYG